MAAGQINQSVQQVVEQSQSVLREAPKPVKTDDKMSIDASLFSR
jgi:hypothetical protein